MSEPTVNASSSRSKPALNARTVACLGMLCAVAYVVMYISKTLLAPIRFGGFLTLVVILCDVLKAVVAILAGVAIARSTPSPWPGSPPSSRWSPTARPAPWAFS